MVKLNWLPFILALGLSATAEARGFYQLTFIGESQLPTGFIFDDIEVGGLSGIDFNTENNRYIAISDDRAQLGPARFYQLNIDLSDGYLDQGDVVIEQMTEILDPNGDSFQPASLDPEAIRLAPFPGLLYWTSEGDANAGVAPFVRVMDQAGRHLAEFTIPEKFQPTADAGIRNNLAFESLTFSFDRQSVFTATENALIQDGPAADINQGSPSRVLQLSATTGQPISEYIYQTDAVVDTPVPADAFSTNGLVELLTVSKTAMIAVERAFSVGVGNTIKLYLTTTFTATDVLPFDSIEDRRRIRPMPKQLLLDLSELGITLDNIEGITFGPTFENGDRSLILVSDNNFNANGQFTQFLAFWLSTPKYFRY